MKNSLVELVFILDRSGSMAGLEKETIGGYNSMIEKQKKEEGEALVTTVLFDHHYERITYRTPISEVKPLTEKEYYPRGMTALLDAIGRTIERIVLEHKEEDKEKPDKTIFVITTDGLENASRNFNYNTIKEMITYEEKEYGWEFIFLGANFDVFNVTDRLGIRRERAVRYSRSRQGVDLNYAEMSTTIGRMRKGETVRDEWKENIEALYKKDEDIKIL